MSENENKVSESIDVESQRFYYLIVGQATCYLENDPEEEYYKDIFNAIISGNDSGISPSDLYRATEAINRVVLESIDHDKDYPLKVDNVQIINIIPMGWYTPTEWDNAKES